jgi:transposase
VTSSVPFLNANERQELLELCKKLKRVEMELDILAKATAWFANNKD